MDSMTNKISTDTKIASIGDAKALLKKYPVFFYRLPSILVMWMWSCSKELPISFYNTFVKNWFCPLENHKKLPNGREKKSLSILGVRTTAIRKKKFWFSNGFWCDLNKSDHFYCKSLVFQVTPPCTSKTSDFQFPIKMKIRNDQIT